MDRIASYGILYRPVGLTELELIYDNGMRTFPTGLPQQPIFCPVLELEYARQIASEWNAKSGQSAGYVTEFKVEEPYISQFEKHRVGRSEHQEFWISTEELNEFNRHIIGHIKVVEGYFGDTFEGFIPDKFGLQGKNAIEQFAQLAHSYIYKRMDFYLEIRRNHKTIFLNYPFWQKYEFKNQSLKDKVLQTIKAYWLTSFPKIALPLPVLAHKDTPLVQHTEVSYVDDEEHQDNPRKGEINLASLVSTADSDIVPAKEINNPAEDTSALKRKDTHSLAEVVHEADLPSEKIEAQMASSVNAGDEDVISTGGTDSTPWENPTLEDTSPVKQPSTSVWMYPITGEAMPAEQFDSDSPADTFHEDNEPIEPTDSHFIQGLKLGLNEKYHEGIDELSKAVEENPDNVVAHTSLGVAFHRVGEDERALSCYETSLRIDPTHAEAHYFRANILYSQGSVREAIAGYTIALGLKPELIEAHLKPLPQDQLTDFTSSPAEMNWIARPAQRILDLNKSLVINPRQDHLLKERATAYYRLRNYVQAIVDYSSYLTRQPQDANAYYSRALAYERIEQPDRALADYQQAITINPQLSDVYINRGIIFGNMGNFRQSLASFTDGIRLAPQKPDGYFNRGITYFQEGTFESAIKDFSNVIRLSPEDAAAYYWRGLSNEEVGRQDKAIADYRRFLEISQDAHTRYEIEQKLSQLENIMRSNASHSSDISDDSQKTSRVISEESAKPLDLYDLIVALGARALNSTWFGSGVTCYGEKAEELYAFTEQNEPIEGHDLIQITAGIYQTMEGDIQAFDPGAASPWIFIRAWGGSGFYIESNDPKIKERLKTHFPTIEEVEGADSPYESLFIET